MPFCALWHSGICCLGYTCAKNTPMEKHGGNGLGYIKFHKNKFVTDKFPLCEREQNEDIKIH